MFTISLEYCISYLFVCFIIGTESLLSNTPNRLRSRRSVSKTTLVSKFLESIDNKVDVKSTAKQKTAKKPCSLYIKNVKIDRHLQELTKTMISREISTSLGKSTSDLPINAKLKNFLYSQTLIYPNEKIYRVQMFRIFFIIIF